MQCTLQNLHEKIALQIALDRCEELYPQVRLRCQNQSVLSETRQRFKTGDERENCTEAEMAVEHSLANGKEKKKRYQYLHWELSLISLRRRLRFFVLQLARENDKKMLYNKEIIKHFPLHHFITDKQKTLF